MKKLLAILCAVMLVLTCSISVFAEGETSEPVVSPYKITISNAVKGKTYSAYKMLDLVYGGEAYYYTVAAGWENFFIGEGAGAAYVKIDTTSGAVTWKNADANEEIKASEAAALAAAAIEYATTNNLIVAASGSVEKAEEDADNATATLVLTVETAGYYLVDSNLGSICALNTTAPNAIVTEKNSIPTVDKTVKEGDTYGESNTANIGDTVEFKSTVDIGEGLATLTWRDDMSAGLTYKEDSLKIVVGETTLTAGTEYTLTSDSTYELIVKFDDEYLASLSADTIIVLTYEAVLNTNAIVGGSGNPNTVDIVYGDGADFVGTPAQTTTYTFSFDLVKTDASDNLLADAVFSLYRGAYDAENETANIIGLVATNNGYRIATSADENNEEVEIVTEFTTNALTKIVIEGLDEDTYILVEKEAPAGYNPVPPVKVSLSSVNSAEMDGIHYIKGGIQVINNTGNVLPSTGGIGTTLFIAIGSIVVLVCGVVLVARKRMSKYVA